MSIEVLKPGALSLLQDRGRYGWQRFGVVVGGAMDEWAHRSANALVGNVRDEATLEATLMGPSLLFRQARVIALCGASLSARIGQAEVPLNRAVLVREGARLDFGKRQGGMRVYLAVRAGFAVPPVMGSRSTYVRGGFGGLQGRALRKGDVLEVGAEEARIGRAEREALGERDFVEIHPPDIVARRDDAQAPGRVRAIAGQHWELFTERARSAFVETDFRISPQSDRMGYRLEGPRLERQREMEMISEGVTFGTVQVPPDGQPIVLMADRQTTGGYPQIAGIASVDLPRTAQLMPGHSLRFELISLAQAQALDLAGERALAALADAVRAAERMS